MLRDEVVGRGGGCERQNLLKGRKRPQPGEKESATWLLVAISPTFRSPKPAGSSQWCIECPPSVLGARALHTVPLTPPTAKIAPITLAGHISTFRLPTQHDYPRPAQSHYPLDHFWPCLKNPLKTELLADRT